jgi:hypothetical protein
MEQFLSIVAKWDHFGQGIFFLIALGAILAFLHQCVFYATVWMRGWPSPGTPTPSISHIFE